MRTLTSLELDCIAGGDGDWSSSDVIVTAPSGGGDPDPYYDPTGDGGGGGGGSPTPNPTPHTPDCTANHAAADIIANLAQQSGPREYSDIIYRASDGSVQHGTIVYGGQYQNAPYTSSSYGVPDGATIIGYEHNHPTFNSDDQELNERFYADNADLNAIQNPQGYADPSRNITVDVQNFAGYILYDQGTSGNNFVVDKYARSDIAGGDYSGSPTQVQKDAPKAGQTDMNNSC